MERTSTKTTQPAVEGDEVEFAVRAGVVAGEDAIAEPAQEAGGGAFGAGAEPAPPPGLSRGRHGRIGPSQRPQRAQRAGAVCRSLALGLDRLLGGCSVGLRGLLALAAPVAVGAGGFDLALRAERGRLADAVAQVVQLGPADRAGALHLDLGDLRRVQREDALDALALHDAADREHLAHAARRGGRSPCR